MFQLPNRFFAVEEGVDKGRELGKEEMITLLGEDDKKEEVIPLKEPKEEKEEVEEDLEDDEEKEEDELDELEDELDGPDDEKLELTTPVRRKEILTKYPKLFKDFPYLEKAYYREQQFTEIVPTIADAKEAVEKAGILDQFEADLGKGNLEKALKAVKGSGDTAFNKLVDDYLPNLAKVDNDAYLHVIGNIVKTTVMSMLEEAESSNDEDLKVAAGILNKFVFRSNKFTPPTALGRKTDDKPDTNVEINKIREEALREKFDTSRESLNTRVNNVLKSTIEANIDPRESMSDYVRKNASREAQESLEKMLDGDKRLSIIIDRLWEQAAKDRFSKTSVDKIKSAYLSRAKTLLPTVIKQARNEALKGLNRRSREDEEKDDTPKKGPLTPGRSASPNRELGGKSDRERAKAIPAGMSSRDYLMKDD